jgi:uroporphyrinogen decarboxylase
MSLPTTPFHTVFSGQTPKHAPLWLMRQAGRYLPEYREARKQAGDFVSLCLNPELACEVTLQPIRRFGFDASIIFSDILMVPYALGQKLWFEEGEGPRLGEPVWHDFDESLMAPVYDAVRLTRSGLPKDTALIGFAGAPWTLLLYALQGKGGGEFQTGRLKVYQNKAEALQRIQVLTNAVTTHLLNQIDAGCDTVQIFDSWAGLCPAPLCRDFIIRPIQTIVKAIKAARPRVPVIVFAKGYNDPATLGDLVQADAIGIDQYTPLSTVITNKVVQGNLDPLALIAGGDVLQQAVEHILTDMDGKAHIFNLGHGIDKTTPVEHVEQLIRLVKG